MGTVLKLVPTYSERKLLIRTKAALLWNVFYKHFGQRCLLILGVVGLIEVVGVGISSYGDDNGKYVAFAGGSFFHLSAGTTFVYFFCKEDKTKRLKVVICFSFYGIAVLSGFLFLIFRNKDTFLLVSRSHPQGFID